MKGRLIAALWRSIRPQQWLTNVVVLAPLVFSRNLFEVAQAARAAVGFVLLCGLSSTTFLVNDLVDRERDRLHPTRRYRPLAAGEMSARQATAAAAVLGAVSLGAALAWRPAFGLAALGYVAIMVGYSLRLRRLPVVDVLSIAAGLIARAVAGALLVDVVVSPWLYLGVGGLGLILALGRIRYEMRLAVAAGTLEAGKYTLDAIAQMNSVTMTFTLMVYSLYTFLAPGSDHSMMLTIPFAIYGLFRYQFLSHGSEEGSPEQVMLADAPLLAAVGLWVAAVVGVLYWRRG